jgi:glutamate--cysteine ligase
VTGAREDPGEAQAIGDTGISTDTEPLTEQRAVAHVHGICFKTGPPRRVGVELEWLVHDASNPALPVAPERVAAALDGLDRPGALPARGLLTTEPGGQLELSSLPAASIGECWEAATRDLAAIREAMQDAGLCLAGYGLDPFRPPVRVVDQPRYVAMEEFFDRTNPAGRVMMCSTASVQVCLDAGEDGTGQRSYAWRWEVLHALGPVLVASFANSPLERGRPTGWKSTRQAVWARLDPGRTRPPGTCGTPGKHLIQGRRAAPGRHGTPGTPQSRGTAAAGANGDLRTVWAEYALDAQLLCIRRPGARSWAAPPGMTFREWLPDGNGNGGNGGGSGRDGGGNGNGGANAPGPTVEDLEYHLSTLFPPVRPRGHLELRMIDAQPGDGWIVPVAVASALLDDPRASEAVMAAAEPLWSAWPDPWLRAARYGPADPWISQVSRECFEAADAALRRGGAPAHVRDTVADFTERYVMRDRCPADDLLEEIT